jgi:hypothetical protein
VAADAESLLAWSRCIASIERLQHRALAQVPHVEPRARLLRTLSLLDVAEALTVNRLHLGADLLARLGAGPVAVSQFIAARGGELKSVRDQVARVVALLREDGTHDGHHA